MKLDSLADILDNWIKEKGWQIIRKKYASCDRFFKIDETCNVTYQNQIFEVSNDKVFIKDFPRSNNPIEIEWNNKWCWLDPSDPDFFNQLEARIEPYV